MSQKLSLKDTSDFACLLELMMVLKDDPSYACLPELFSIIGHEKLLLLAKYAGGTVIRIPTVEELTDMIESFQWYYDVYIKKTKKLTHVPFKYRNFVLELQRIYSDANIYNREHIASSGSA